MRTAASPPPRVYAEEIGNNVNLENEEKGAREITLNNYIARAWETILCIYAITRYALRFFVLTAANGQRARARARERRFLRGFAGVFNDPSRRFRTIYRTFLQQSLSSQQEGKFCETRRRARARACCKTPASTAKSGFRAYSARRANLMRERGRLFKTTFEERRSLDRRLNIHRASLPRFFKTPESVGARPNKSSHLGVPFLLAYRRNSSAKVRAWETRRRDNRCRDSFDHFRARADARRKSAARIRLLSLAQHRRQ